MSQFGKFFSIVYTVACLFTITEVAIAKPAGSPHTSQQMIERIRRRLAKEVDPGDQITPENRFWVSSIPGTNLLLAYARGGVFCWTGGCTFRILRPVGRSFQDTETIDVTFTPITLLPTRHHGLPDLGMTCRYDAMRLWQGVARFNGKVYQSRCDIHISADPLRPIGRVLLNDTGAGFPVEPHPKDLRRPYSVSRRK